MRIKFTGSVKSITGKEIAVPKYFPCTTKGLRQALNERRNTRYHTWGKLEIVE